MSKPEGTNRVNSLKRRIQLIVICTIASVLAGLCIWTLFFNATSSASNLRAKYSVERADIGIPGITKMYDAGLVNVGTRPVRIEVCSFVSDAGAPGEAVAFSVQKYDAKTSAWVTIVDASDAGACHPYPLGWATAQLKSKWLWPGQRVSMGEEATAARGFRKGNLARFVLFSSFKHSNQSPSQAVPTPSFLIDEEAGSGVEGLRIRH